MRRRQVLAQKALEEEQVVNTACPTCGRPYEQPKQVGKGNCPKCGKYCSRGLHFHVRACRGN